MIHTFSTAGLTLTRGERTLFRDLAFTLSAGEAIALTGANGAGKTSLIRAIAGFLRPEAGTIAFHDAASEAIDPATARAYGVHHLGHLDALKAARTARQELDFQAQWLGPAPDGVARAVEALGLKPLLDLEVRKLSAGQRRRLALARLITAPRDVWLLDEPLGPLDVLWREVAGQILQRHLDGGGLILAAVHDPLPIPARALDLGVGR